MEILSNDQVQDILKNPLNANNISEGRAYESRLRLYTETKFDKGLDSENAWKDFKKFVQNILSKKKYDKIEKFMQTPLPVVDITESCLSDLYKVFEARNRYFKVDVKKATAQKQIDPVLAEMKIEAWIEKKGRDVIKNKANSIVVIDKDEEGKPYPLLIETKRLYDYKLAEKSDVDGQLEYVAFIHSKDKEGEQEITRYAFYDSEKYRVFETKDNESFTVITDEVHTAGYCPAIMFMEHSLNDRNPLNRKVPFSNALTKLMQWQVFDYYQLYADHYAPFPIIEAPEESCGVPNCSSGMITEEQEYIADDEVKVRNVTRPCTACESRSIIGPGTVVRVKAKSDKDDPSEAGVFKVMDSPTQSLEYIQNKLDRIEKHIVLKTVGIDSVIDNQAINKDQVHSSYEKRINVLLDLKGTFDRLYRWMAITSARLIVKEVEIMVHANFGTEFYLLTEEDLHKKFETAKEIGLPETELDMLFKLLIDTKYKGNPSKVNRAMIVKFLDPMPFANREEAFRANERGLLSDEDYMFKLNLVNNIDRFELEQAPLVQFGEEMEPFKKLEKIKEILKSYTNVKDDEKDGRGE